MRLPFLRYCANCNNDLTNHQDLNDIGKSFDEKPFGICAYPLVGDSQFLFFCNLNCFREFLCVPPVKDLERIE